MGSYNPHQISSFVEDTQSNVNANTTTVTNSLDAHNASFFRFQVTGVTGTHATHVVTMQVSMDESTWIDTGTTVTGTGLSSTSARNIAGFARLKVTTVEGDTSTIDLILQGK